MTDHIRRPHDLGGLDLGPIDRAGHAFEPWEKQIDSIARLVGDKKRRIMTIDEMRRAVEDLGPGIYDTHNYYQRWVMALGNLLLEKGVFTVDALSRKMAEVEARWASERAKPKDAAR